MKMSVSSEARPKIVVGVDGSDSSYEALSWAAAQAEITGSEIEIVTAWEIPNTYGWYPPYPEEYDPEADARRMLQAIAEKAAREHPGLKVDIRVMEGHPAPALIEASRNAQLLVVGSRGHGAFVEMLLGSVSQHCVSHCACPVVVVRHPHQHVHQHVHQHQQ